MTPKEKAYQLINKFYFALPNNGLQEGINNVNDRWSEAKKCALIAVDELIKNSDYVGVNYWQEVKQEIEKI